jgi:hypothetical protein
MCILFWDRGSTILIWKLFEWFHGEESFKTRPILNIFWECWQINFWNLMKDWNFMAPGEFYSKTVCFELCSFYVSPYFIFIFDALISNTLILVSLGFCCESWSFIMFLNSHFCTVLILACLKYFVEIKTYLASNRLFFNNYSDIQDISKFRFENKMGALMG